MLENIMNKKDTHIVVEFKDEFYGQVNVVKVLPYSSPAEFEEDMKIARKNGGKLPKCIFSLTDHFYDYEVEFVQYNCYSIEQYFNKQSENLVNNMVDKFEMT